MIELHISKADYEKLMNKLNEEKRDKAILNSLTRSASYMEGWIKTNRLMGPRPRYLNRVSSSLFFSIKASPSVKLGNTYWARIGSDIIGVNKFPYGKYWEGVAPFDMMRSRKAKPFMRPALEDKRNQQLVKEDLSNSLRKVLEA